MLSESHMTFSSQPRVFGNGKGRREGSKRAYVGSSMVIVSAGWIEESCLSAVVVAVDDERWR